MQMEPRDSRIVGRTIFNVMDLFWINPKESAKAIRKLITPDEVRNKGAEQGYWIARKVSLLFGVDPELAAEIYTAFFAYEEKSEEQTSMGGGRIMALTSNKRQDYHHAHWQLGQDFPLYLERNFDRCAKLVGSLINSYIALEGKARDKNQVITYCLSDAERTILVDYSSIWDGSSVRDEVQNIADTYFRKLEEVAQSADRSAEAAEIALRFLSDAKYAYTPRKILKLAKVSPSALMPVVYQYESLAVDLLVKVTERYLAEERMTLQQDIRCREELIDILETFVNAGWPSARRLSYRLEEIFR